MKEHTREALLILQEECSEVTQATSKCFRFGIDGLYQDQSNRDRLEQELGDVLAMIDILTNQGVVSAVDLQLAKLRKFEKLQKWSTIPHEYME
jgi:NTP pyrophosphatase (non-canonical NTP hydrolase)